MSNMKIHIQGTSESSRFLEHTETIAARKAVDGVVKLDIDNYQKIISHLMAAIASVGSVELDAHLAMQEGNEHEAQRFLILHTASANMIRSLERLGVTQSEAVAATNALMADGRDQQSKRN